MGGGSIRRRSARGVAVATAAVLLGAPSAHAITNGYADEGRHPYVGALVTHDGKDRKKRLICSGSLLSATVFITTAHCLEDEPSRLYVSFDAFVGAPDVGPEVTLYPGSAVQHPEFVDATAPGDSHDIGIVKLDAPIQGVQPAELPGGGVLDRRQRAGQLAGTTLELVGYGREGKNAKGFFFGGGGRRYAYTAFQSLDAFELVNDQRGTLGGSCNGDSGGPVLLRGTRTVVALISDGDPDCAIDGINYRLDTASARDFLDDHVAVPPPPA